MSTPTDAAAPPAPPPPDPHPSVTTEPPEPAVRFGGELAVRLLSSARWRQ